MKKLYYVFGALALLLSAACQPDAVEPPVNPARENILGKWKMDKNYSDYYQPANVLMDSEEYIGQPGDSVVFMRNNLLYAYAPPSMIDEFDYHFVNDSTIIVDEEEYKIRKLTATELYLYQEEINPVTNERFIARGYFYR